MALGEGMGESQGFKSCQKQSHPDMLVLMSEIYIHSERVGTLARMHLVIHMIHPSAHTLQLRYFILFSIFSV